MGPHPIGRLSSSKGELWTQTRTEERQWEGSGGDSISGHQSWERGQILTPPEGASPAAALVSDAFLQTGRPHTSMSNCQQSPTPCGSRSPCRHSSEARSRKPSSPGRARAQECVGQQLQVSQGSPHWPAGPPGPRSALAGGVTPSRLGPCPVLPSLRPAPFSRERETHLHPGL